MEFIVLGLLTLKEQTIYELRKAFQSSISFFYSDSLGSLQAALKKLLSKEWIAFSERTEAGRSKKIYRIVPAGSEAFLQWLQSPIPADKFKDHALTRLFFMGLLPPAQRTPLMRAHLGSLQAMLANLKGLQQQATQAQAPESKRDIVRFQLLTLQFGIDQLDFEMKWYETLVNQLMKEGKSNESLH